MVPLVALLVGVVAGFIGTLLGIGGGAIMVPALVISGVDVKEAVPASLVAVVGTSLGGLRYLFSKGLVSIPVAVALEGSAIAGAIVGVEVFGRLGSSELEVALGLVLAAMGFAFIARERMKPPEARARVPPYRLALGASASFGAGVASAMLGIGGGVVKVPIMVLALGLPVHVAIATSKLMVGLTALAGVAGHALKTGINWSIALPLALGTFTGATAASRVLVRLKAKTLYYVAASYYFIMGTYMALKGMGLA